MKNLLTAKRTISIILVMISSLFYAQCNALTSMNENFDSYTTGYIVPPCWDRIVSGNGNQSISASGTPASGTLHLYQSSNGSANQTIVVLPSFSNINAGTNWLRFKARVTTNRGSLDVGYITDVSDASTFITIQKVTFTNTTYDATAQKTVFVPTSVPSNARLAVRNNGIDAASLGMYWDDVVWETMPSCQYPVNISFSNINTTSADVSWLAPSTIPANGYEYYYSTNNTDPIASTIASGTVTTNSLSIPAGTLSPNTTYYFWVRSVCNSTDKSDWTIGGNSFKTLCNSITGSLSENFDTYGTGAIVPDCWDRIISGGGTQSIVSASPASGTRNVTQYSSSAYNQTIVVLPPLSNVNAGNNSLKFKARVLAGTGIIEIGYVTSLAASSYVPLQSFNVSNTAYTSSYNISLNIPSSVPANARLAIRNPGTSTSQLYWDDVVWEGITLNVQEKELSEKKIDIYPNPFYNILKITDSKNLCNSIITDMSGRIIKKTGNVSELILGNLKPGEYWLHLYYEGKATRSFKIIKKGNND